MSNHVLMQVDNGVTELCEHEASLVLRDYTPQLDVFQEVTMTRVLHHDVDLVSIIIIITKSVFVVVLITITVVNLVFISIIIIVIDINVVIFV